MNQEFSSNEVEELLLSRSFQPKVKDQDGTFEGLGAVFEEVHPTSSMLLSPEWKDRILPGSFKRTLSEHKKNQTMPAMLYMHERGNLVGAWKDMEEVKDGLFNAGQVAKSAHTPQGTNLLELMRMGGLTGLSIGFKVRKAKLDQEAKMRDILDVEVGEVSLVDIPGIQVARVTDVKLLRGGPKDIQILEQVLRDAGLSRKEAKALLAEGFNALRDAVANEAPDQHSADRIITSSDTTALAASIRELASSIRK